MHLDMRTCLADMTFSAWGILTTGRRCCWCGPCATFPIYMLESRFFISSRCVSYSMPFRLHILLFWVVARFKLLWVHYQFGIWMDRSVTRHFLLYVFPFLDNWVVSFCCAFADLSALISCWNYYVRVPASGTEIANCQPVGCLMIGQNLCSDAPQLFFSLRTLLNWWCWFLFIENQWSGVRMKYGHCSFKLLSARSIQRGSFAFDGGRLILILLSSAGGRHEQASTKAARSQH